MARIQRKLTERQVSRMVWKHGPTWLSALLFLLTLSLLVKTIYARFWKPESETFPLNQLERGYVSRQDALTQLRDFIKEARSQGQMVDRQELLQAISEPALSRFAKQISKDLSVLQAMGLQALADQLTLLAGVSEVADSSFPANSSSSFSRHFLTHRLCYETSFTPQGNHRQVDPSFCPRLVSLLNDIEQGRQPPLLTVFTWLPDPLVDVDRLRRRLIFDNWDLLRPIVQPVLVSDSRANMALANFYDWPCLPVATYGSQGIPVFRSMTRAISTQFNSTFYGYVRSTTVFDASLVETLLKLKEIYVDKNGDDWTSFHPEGGNKARPVLVYGRALRSSHVGNIKDLQHISDMINSNQSHAWPDRKDSLVYFFYAGVDFEDTPDLIVHDKYLTSLLVSRSMALGHSVVDATSTVYCVHIFRDQTTSEWGREYLSAQPHDPQFNKRLGGQYFHALGIRKPEKWFNEVGTKFAKSGSIFIDIRSERSAGGQGQVR